MRQEVISSANLSIYAEISLAIFVICFIGIAIRAWLLSREESLEIASLPLNDGTERAAEEVPR